MYLVLYVQGFPKMTPVCLIMNYAPTRGKHCKSCLHQKNPMGGKSNFYFLCRKISTLADFLHNGIPRFFEKPCTYYKSVNCNNIFCLCYLPPMLYFTALLMNTTVKEMIIICIWYKEEEKSSHNLAYCYASPLRFNVLTRNIF